VLSYPRIEELLKHEPSLVYKLLRYLNSPLVGLRIEIHGVREAIALLGEREFRRWVSVVAVVSMASDKAPELIRTALTRGYFCEDLSRLIGMSAQSSDLFLMGLLSVTDALLDRPLENEKNGAVDFSTAPVELFRCKKPRQAAASASTAAM